MKTLKRRPIPEDAEGTIETFVRGARAQMPQDPKRLQKIIHALLKRIERTNPKEAFYLIGFIQGLAGVERRFPLHPPEQLAREEGNRHRHMVEANELALDLVRLSETITLEAIESGKVSRTAHDHGTVILQRDMLTNYLQAHPFRIRLRRVNRDAGCRDAAKQWLASYGRAIWDLLYALPCHCKYRDSFDNLLDSKALSTCSGSSRLLDLLLAELHISTPDAIRKILSHVPSSRL